MRVNIGQDLSLWSCTHCLLSGFWKSPFDRRSRVRYAADMRILIQFCALWSTTPRWRRLQQTVFSLSQDLSKGERDGNSPHASAEVGIELSMRRSNLIHAVHCLSVLTLLSYEISFSPELWHISRDQHELWIYHSHDLLLLFWLLRKDSLWHWIGTDSPALGNFMHFLQTWSNLNGGCCCHVTRNKKIRHQAKTWQKAED